MDQAQRAVSVRDRPLMSRSLARLTRRSLIRLGLASSIGLALGARVPVPGVLAASDPSGWIALTRNRDVVLTRPDGSDTHSVLTVGRGEFVFDVALSPDGTRLAYAYYTTPTGTGGGGADLMLVTLTPEVGTPTLLAARDGPGVLLGVPGWAPDGHSLVFEAIGFSAAGQPTIRCDAIGADGSGRRTLVENARYPTLAPDGESLAYVRSRPTGDALYVRPLAGGAERQIVSDVDMAAISYPRFAPDGSQIAFAGINLSSLRPSATAPDLLRLDLTAPDAAPASLRDAGRFPRARGLASHGLPTDPWVVAPDGSGLRRVVQMSGDDVAVAWSPDSQQLAVSGAYGLSVVTVADGSEHDLSEDGSFGALDWRQAAAG
jgi:Tol biopolymer transport system component